MRETCAIHDRNGSLHVVGQILIKVGQRVGVSGKPLVLLSEAIAGCDFAEAVEVDEVESTAKE